MVLISESVCCKVIPSQEPFWSSHHHHYHHHHHHHHHHYHHLVQYQKRREHEYENELYEEQLFILVPVYKNGLTEQIQQFPTGSARMLREAYCNLRAVGELYIYICTALCRKSTYIYIYYTELFSQMNQPRHTPESIPWPYVEGGMVLQPYSAHHADSRKHTSTWMPSLQSILTKCTMPSSKWRRPLRRPLKYKCLPPLSEPYVKLPLCLLPHLHTSSAPQLLLCLLPHVRPSAYGTGDARSASSTL